ncbi:hypothetical protein MtrunA17_Chr7g0246891 [Medicago truncatula]|uniref:Uncharacterized protein n=1 Tax=Medicago truncatula TaxID=3880 RepID=G7L2J1_MEDTR|nr:hypothetical protein MTR_7g076500 [Medicago truncatula]RHN46875.1 hypothetical protein MtrunA17_Chr7g0246891 [Medicago truncatula]
MDIYSHISIPSLQAGHTHQYPLLEPMQFAFIPFLTIAKESSIADVFLNDPILHRRMAITRGVHDKRCERCGKLKMETLHAFHLSSPQGFKRVPEDEQKQICSNCKNLDFCDALFL